MRITKVYTRAGDKGHTQLVGGKSVPKDHLRIQTYGAVDELNSIIGLARVFNSREDVSEQTTFDDPVTRADQMLARIQNDLFNVGSDLATPPDARWENMLRVG